MVPPVLLLEGRTAPAADRLLRKSVLVLGCLEGLGRWVQSLLESVLPQEITHSESLLERGPNDSNAMEVGVPSLVLPVILLEVQAAPASESLLRKSALALGCLEGLERWVQSLLKSVLPQEMTHSGSLLERGPNDSNAMEEGAPFLMRAGFPQPVKRYGTRDRLGTPSRRATGFPDPGLPGREPGKQQVAFGVLPHLSPGVEFPSHRTGTDKYPAILVFSQRAPSAVGRSLYRSRFQTPDLQWLQAGACRWNLSEL